MLEQVIKIYLEVTGLKNINDLDGKTPQEQLPIYEKAIQTLQLNGEIYQITIGYEYNELLSAMIEFVKHLKNPIPNKFYRFGISDEIQ